MQRSGENVQQQLLDQYPKSVLSMNRSGWERIFPSIASAKI
jgi:hypothetical protein